METPSPRLIALEQMLGLEHQLLEALLFKLTQAKLVLAANEARYVGSALHEVQEAMEDIKEAEERRASAVADLAEEWEIPAAVLTLAYLSDHAPPSMRERFGQLRYGLMDLAGDIEKITKQNQRLANANLETIRGTLDILHKVTESGGTYDASGRALPAARRPRRLDTAI